MRSCCFSSGARNVAQGLLGEAAVSGSEKAYTYFLRCCTQQMCAGVRLENSHFSYVKRQLAPSELVKGVVILTSIQSASILFCTVQIGFQKSFLISVKSRENASSLLLCFSQSWSFSCSSMLEKNSNSHRELLSTLH